MELNFQMHLRKMEGRGWGYVWFIETDLQCFNSERELLTEVPWKAISRHFCSNGMEQRAYFATYKVPRDILLDLKILGSGLLAQSGINQKQLKYIDNSELNQKPTTYFSLRNTNSPFLFSLMETPALPFHSSDWPINTTLNGGCYL